MNPSTRRVVDKEGDTHVPGSPRFFRRSMQDAILDAVEQGDYDKVAGPCAGLLEDAKNTNIGPCLEYACNLSQPECVRLLLAHAAVDQPANSNGSTPLYVACGNSVKPRV